MTTQVSIKNYSPSCNQILSVLKRTLLTSVLIVLTWLPGLYLDSAFAMPNVVASSGEITAPLVQFSSTDNDRMSALIACLPKQLSQPNLKRAWSEMGNDQLERAFNLKANPKLSQAEIELNNCMSRKGFTK